MSDTIAKLRDLLLNSSKAGRLRGLLDSIYGAASTGAEAYGSASSPMSAEHSGLLGGLLMDMSPLGDAKSAYDGVQSAREGDWLGAGLGGLGALPMVPNLGMMAGMKLKHGSGKLFDSFDLGAQKTTLGGFSNHGVSLTPDTKTAERYASDFSGGRGFVYDVDANIKNPLNLPASDYERLQSLTSKIDSGSALTEMEQITLDVLMKKHGINANNLPHPIDAIKKSGFDAISKDAGRQGMAEREFLVFDPEMAKILGVNKFNK